MVQSYDYRKDYYRILGVTRSATPTDVKRAYYNLAKLFHPDKNAGDVAKAEKFKEVLEAYEVLSDSFARRSYEDARNIFGFRYTTPDDNKEDDSGTYDETPPKRGRKDGGEANARETRSDKTPPDFRKRQRSTYSYTYPSPKTSNDPNGSPESSTDSTAGAQASSQMPKDESNPDAFVFNDYYDYYFGETSLLPRLRNEKAEAVKQLRCRKLYREQARYNIDYPAPFADVSTLDAIFSSAKFFERSCWTRKRDADRKLNEHLARANQVMAEEKARRAGHEGRFM